VHFSFKSLHISSKSPSIAMKIKLQREFCLLFRLVVSKFQNSMTVRWRFSRDHLKNLRILNEHFLSLDEHFFILTLLYCSSYQIVPTIKFSSSGTFWITRYKSTKPLSSSSYLKKGWSAWENSFLFLRRQYSNSVKSGVLS
jgi:hypothetical protein